VLVERTSPDGVVALASPLLARAGFAHAFSTRLGGVSAAPFDTLNLQSTQANARIPAGDPRDLDANIRENHARFAAAAGLARDATVADLSQVHSCSVARAADALAARVPADALTSPCGGCAVLIRVADCVPVLIADPSTGHVAAVHAGWRGVVSGIVPAALDALRSIGADVRACVAAVGPCISAQHFEIGPEVADALVAADLGSCVVAPGVHGPKHHADLVAAVALQLARAGVARESIDAEPPCTYADRARLFSYRRDGVASGRLAAIIAPRD
jgi:polyphenol oxidase